jgi:hypothetical protein
MDLSPSSEANVSFVPQSLLFEPHFQTSKLLLLPKGHRGGLVVENKTVCIVETSIIVSIVPEVSIMLGADKGDVVTSPTAVRQ